MNYLCIWLFRLHHVLFCFKFEAILILQISHRNLHFGAFLKKLEDLRKNDSHGSYGLEMTSGCLYRQDLCSARGVISLIFNFLTRYSRNHVQLSPPLGYFGKH